jgi:type I restriction enzyme S subunit
MIIPTVPLSKIAKPISRPVDVLPGTSYRTIGVKWWGEGAYERETIDGSQTAAKTFSLVKEGDLIINKIWVRHGSTAIAGKDVDGCAASGEFPTFALDLTEVLPRWLHWQTKTREFWEKCARLSQGTSGKNRIKPDVFLSIEIPLPPLEEQRRIVARVEELAGKIEEARSLRCQTAQEANILLTNISGSLFEEIGKRVGLKKLGNITLKITDGEHATPRRCEFGNYLLSARNIQNNKIDLKTVDYVDRDEFARIQRRCDPSVGDVLISCSGSIGKVAIVDKSDTYVMVRSVAMVRPDPAVLNPEYLAHSLRSRLLQSQMTEKAKASAQANLFLGKIKTLQLPVPSLPEQHRIVAYLDNLQAKVDEMKRLREQALKELDAMLPSILDKAFKGEL